MAVEGVNRKWRRRIMGGWNEADKYVDETKEVQREADGLICGPYFMFC